MGHSDFIIRERIHRVLFRLSWPVLVSMLVHFSYNIVDTIFVARLGAEYVAAVTYCFPILFVIFSVAQGLAIGTTALIAQYTGAGNKRDASNTAEHSLLLAIIIAVVITILIITFQRSIFGLMGATQDILSITLQYSTIIFGAFSVVFIAFICNSMLRGVGDMKTPMRALVASSLLNVVLDPLFIFGIGPFPMMGIRGAAVASVISRVFMVCYVLFHLFRRQTQIVLSPRYFRFNKRIFKRLMEVGFPASIASTLTALGNTILMRVVSMYGAMAVAAWGIIIRLDSIIMLPLIGIGTATVTIIGQNLGAGNIKRTNEIARFSLILATLCAGVLALLLWFNSEFLIKVFVDNVEVLEFGRGFFSVMVFGYPLFGFMYTSVSILQGSGHLKPVVIATILRWGSVLGLSCSLRGVLKNNYHGLFYIILFGIGLAAAYLAMELLKGKWRKPVIKPEGVLEEELTFVD